MAYKRITNAKTGVPEPGLEASREGRGFCRKVNAKTAINALTVLTDVDFLLPIELDKRYIVRGFYMNLGTLSDWVTAEIGVTQNADGSGTFTALSPMFRIDSGAAATGMDPHQATIDPPLAVTRTHGHALTARVQGNDAAAALTLALNGWWEDEE
jgi:hypothetical protein